MTFWNNIYANFDPVAFSLGSIKVHWYGIMYVTALLVGIFVAKWLVKKDKLPVSQDILDNYIIWIEIGVIIGARVGYLAFYQPNFSQYLLEPWQMFNPMQNGVFVGISGMSFHGAVLGFLAGSTLFSWRYKINQWFMLDIAAVAIPAGYFFGRIGNFVNQELVGRQTDVSWGILVEGILRHPSQLYEALTEGIIVFIIMYAIRKRKTFHGQLISIYLILYGIARFSAEMFRAPDPQIGYVYSDWMTKGQQFSLIMIAFGIALYLFMKFYGKKEVNL
ncbi:MAG TPA: prolipoprotein diacylglyceryl transferase [Campylobacterales bacterium]|nr:prolipoprotein diacylglyceryl transferase [Campylobacterales bacterium]